MDSNLRKAAEDMVTANDNLEKQHRGSYVISEYLKASQAVKTKTDNLRAALAEPDDEPVAWINRFENHDGLSFFEGADTPVLQAGKYQCSVPLYTHTARGRGGNNA